MNNRVTAGMKIWLFDLAHGNLDSQKVLKGFIEHYAIYDCSISDVIREIHFCTTYGESGVRTAKEALERALQDFINPDIGQDKLNAMMNSEK